MRDHNGRAAVILQALILVGCVTVVPRPTATVTPSASSMPTGAPIASSPSPSPTQTVPAQPTGGQTTPPNTGDVIFEDDFSGSTRFLTSGTHANGGGEYVDGIYRVFGTRRESLPFFGSGGTTSVCAGAGCEAPSVAHEDMHSVVVEVDAKQTAGSLDGAFGIACNYRAGGPTPSFVSLTISADGRRHAVGMYQPIQGREFGAVPFDVILGGVSRTDPHPAIKTGLGAVNRLRAECSEDAFRLFANGELVAEGTLDQPVANTSEQIGIGLIAGFSPSTRVEVDFDNLVVSELSGMPPIAPREGSYYVDPLQEQNGTWITGTVLGTEWSFTGAAYRAEAFSAIAGSVYVKPFAMLPPDDVSVAVDITFVDGDLAGLAGVNCRWNGVTGYGFDITPDGQYWIYRVDELDELPVVLADFTPHSAIRPGLGIANRISFACIGDTLTAYANDVVLEQVTDPTLSERGMALTVVHFGPMTVDFANYSESYAPIE